MSAEFWDTYATCPGCGLRVRVPYGDPFFAPFEVCPKCGERNVRGHDRFRFDAWPISTQRWVSDARLFKPSTWGTGHWETCE